MADILIRGMELPKNEPLLVKINPDGSVSTTAKNGYKKYEAVPVPPHGRLVDVDAVILDGGPYEYDEWCKWALDRYQDAPTIIQASE